MGTTSHTTHDQEDLALLNLITTLGSVHNALAEEEASHYFLVEKSLPLVRTLENKGVIDGLQARKIYYKIYDRICGFDTVYLSNFISWAESHPINENREYWIASVQTCSACRYLRLDCLEQAEYHIQAATESIRKYSHAQPDNEELAERLAYLYLVQGVYLFKQGTIYFEEAEKLLVRFIEYSGRVTSIQGYFSGYASYLLYKIYKEFGNISLAIIHYQKANLDLSNTIKRDFCMFDYRKIMGDLDDNKPWTVKQ